MSQADNVRVDQIEERVRQQAEVLTELEKRIEQLEKLVEGEDLMPVVYPEPVEPKPTGRRSG